jgi:putative transposase
MADTMKQDLVHNALKMAIEQRGIEDAQGQLLFHSDRGSQYAAHDYRARLDSHCIVASMSRKGNCWDNAPVESFFATLKKELVHREKYQNHT